MPRVHTEPPEEPPGEPESGEDSVLCLQSSGGWGGLRARPQSLRMTKAIASLLRNMYLSRTALHHCPRGSEV